MNSIIVRELKFLGQVVLFPVAVVVTIAFIVVQVLLAFVPIIVGLLMVILYPTHITLAIIVTLILGVLDLRLIAWRSKANDCLMLFW